VAPEALGGPEALTQALPAKLRRAEASNTWMQPNSDELDLASRVRAEAYAASSDPAAREQEAVAKAVAIA